MKSVLFDISNYVNALNFLMGYFAGPYYHPITIDIGIDIDSGYPWKIDIGIDIDFLKFERLTLALTLTFLSSMSMGNQNPLKLSFY